MFALTKRKLQVFVTSALVKDFFAIINVSSGVFLALH